MARAKVDMSVVEDNVDDENTGRSRGSNGRMRAGTHSSDAPVRKEAHSQRELAEVDERKLVAPEPQPGMRQRWVYVGNTTSAGTQDQANWATRMRQGWRPRPVETIPDAHLYQLPMLQSGATGILQMSGYILCEMPEDQYARLVAYDNDKADQQDDAGIAPLAAAAASAGRSLPNQKVYREVEVRVENNGGRRPPPVMVE